MIIGVPQILALTLLFVSINLYTTAVANEHLFKGSETNAKDTVKRTLKQLSLKSDDYKKMDDTEGSKKFDAYAKALGFASIDEWKGAEMGRPIPGYSLHLDNLLT